MRQLLKFKLDYINTLMDKIESKKKTSLVDILREEIEKLKKLNSEYKDALDSKKVIHKEVHPNKVRYYLKDGSTYVIRNNKYKYLYDNKTKIMTYEFSNGQIERTMPYGIKEIRYPDGSIVIKSDEKEYEVINKKE
ncbi:hypothetical protein NBO_3g0039 [Nosema bombycis CQ1]|uniref:T-complex protein 10 n=1 Tax=Nosema bombycis (strain CQ1 / CVCC 102059) TaxID=578461 RepID=R0MRG8_NOSB1|nr:hypothetical protein NBO_3g0039 [Nosema bombycis CQ1]|eukprot:EOB15488.1 hypothetical protein NBO_3g0039 [Nosema bombycis CQ1]